MRQVRESYLFKFLWRYLKMRFLLMTSSLIRRRPGLMLNLVVALESTNHLAKARTYQLRRQGQVLQLRTNTYPNGAIDETGDVYAYPGVYIYSKDAALLLTRALTYIYHTRTHTRTHANTTNCRAAGIVFTLIALIASLVLYSGYISTAAGGGKGWCNYHGALLYLNFNSSRDGALYWFVLTSTQ